MFPSVFEFRVNEVFTDGSGPVFHGSPSELKQFCKLFEDVVWNFKFKFAGGKRRDLRDFFHTQDISKALQETKVTIYPQKGSSMCLNHNKDDIIGLEDITITIPWTLPWDTVFSYPTVEVCGHEEDQVIKMRCLKDLLLYYVENSYVRS
jgi:hypothetical protein